MHDRLDGVSMFVEVVEAGGFARAAERLSLTRSAVGKTIARLETRLGVRLFHRTTRMQSLTEEGRLYHERCVRALAELRAGETLLEAGRSEVSGRLRVSMPIVFGRLCVAPILTDLARVHPKLELELSFSDVTVDIIAQGFDLAVRNVGLGSNSNGLRMRRLATQTRVLCASPDYLHLHGIPRTLDDLAAHDALLYARTGFTQSWQLLDKNGEMRELTPHARLRLDDLESIANAASQGVGVAMLPHWLVRERIRTEQLCVLLPDFPSTNIICHALWPDVQHMPPRLRLAIDALVEKMPVLVGAA